jgi:hypothetical protein
MQTTAMIYGKSHKKRYSAKISRSLPDRNEPKEKKSPDQIENLLEKAKQDYKSGKIGFVQQDLHDLLAIIHHNDGLAANPKPRPKSARPTRNSDFPISSAFSECDSEYEPFAPSEFEIEKYIDEEGAKEILAKSTITKLGHSSATAKRGISDEKKSLEGIMFLI